MRFVCDVSRDDGNFAILALNPVTKTEVKISPPFEWKTTEELEIFARNFELYCNVSWQFGRLDPSKINPSSWPKKLITSVMPMVNSEAPPDRPPPDPVNE